MIFVHDSEDLTTASSGDLLNNIWFEINSLLIFVHLCSQCSNQLFAKSSNNFHFVVHFILFRVQAQYFRNAFAPSGRLFRSFISIIVVRASVIPFICSAGYLYYTPESETFLEQALFVCPLDLCRAKDNELSVYCRPQRLVFRVMYLLVPFKRTDMLLQRKHEQLLESYFEMRSPCKII